MTKLSEADYRSCILEPQLEKLGYPHRNIEFCRRESGFKIYSGSYSLDYLFIVEGRPILDIEAKVNENLFNVAYDQATFYARNYDPSQVIPYIICAAGPKIKMDKAVPSHSGIGIEFEELKELLPWEELISKIRQALKPTTIETAVDTALGLESFKKIFKELYEALRLSKRPKFKTDDEVISIMNDILRATLIKRSRKKIFKARRLPKRVIDPACGSGGFCGGILGYLEDRIDKSQFLETNLFACHVDQFAVSTAKTFIDLLLPGRQEVFNIFHHNGLCSDRVHSWEKDDLGDVIAEECFDLIISNPPGGADYNLGYDDELRSNFPLEKHKKGNLQNAPLFIQRAIQLARDGGKICLIVPDGTLANVQLQYLHKHIFDTCRVKAVVSLPRGIFPNVPSKMSILYMIKDKKPEVKEPIFMAEVKTGTESETGEEYNLESELEEILREFRMFHKN